MKRSNSQIVKIVAVTIIKGNRDKVIINNKKSIIVLIERRLIAITSAPLKIRSTLNKKYKKRG